MARVVIDGSHGSLRGKGQRERLAMLVSCLAAHREVDWADMERSAGSVDERSRIQRFRAIARIAHHQRECQQYRGFEEFCFPCTLGEFTLLGELGRGSMGVVYEARQDSLGRRVALKVLSRSLDLTEEGVARFQREARTAARLHHSNIVPVYTTGEAHGRRFFAMELIEGCSMRELLDQMRHRRESDTEPTLDATSTSSSAPETLRSGSHRRDSRWYRLLAELIAGAADALEHAHARGVIHRDVKPANLLFSGSRQLCVTDFSVARVLEEPGMTLTGTMVGTPAYMSPEQVLGGRRKVDHRTDIFSLGAVLYECVTGKHTFPGDSREAVIRSILTVDPVSPRRIDGRIPRDLETICLKALAKDVRDRYQTARALAEDLRAFARGDLIHARRAGPLKRLARSARRNPPATLAGGAVGLALALGLLAWQTWEMKTRADAQRVLSDARLSLASGDYRAAFRMAGEILEGDPDIADARVVRARAALMLFDPEEVESQAEALVARNAGDWRAHLILAMLSSGYGNEPGWGAQPIERHLAVVEQLAPETADAYYLRAIATVSDADAIELLDKALRLDPAHGDALLERAVRHASLAHFSECLLDCERLIVARPKSAEGHILKGSVLLDELRDVAAAAAAADRAIAIDPRNGQAYVLRGAVEETRREFELAYGDYRRAIELQPSHPRQYGKLAGLLLRRNRAEESAHVARKAVELFPRERQLYETWFEAEHLLGDPGGALAVADRLREQSMSAPSRKERAGFLAAAGELYRRAEQWESAISAATDALLLDGSSYGAYTVRAAAHRALGDLEEYRADCEAAAGLEIEQPSALADLAFRMCRHCRFEPLARDVTNDLVTRFPDWPEAWHWHAFVRGSYGDHKGSVASYRKAVEIAPAWAASWAALGEMLTMFLDRHEEAIAALSRSIEIAPWQVDGPADNAYFARTWANLSLGNLDQAQADIEKVLEQTGPMRGPLALQAALLIHRGRCVEGQAALDRYSDAPGQGDPRLTLPYFEVTAKSRHCPDWLDLQAALRLVESGLGGHPDDPEFEAVRGMLLYRLGRLEEARRALDQGVRSSPRFFGTIAIPLFRAMTLHRLGKTASAAETYRGAVEMMRLGNCEHRPELACLREEAARVLGIEEIRRE